MVYYSSASGNTRRFVDRLGYEAARIPIEPDAPLPDLRDPFVLICPTYADGEGRGAVPKQVIRFLNNPENRNQLCGVIGSGNRNFGATYALAGRIISEKCNVPLLYTFELAGTQTDIDRLRAGLDKLGDSLCSTTS
ncbi:class Ib ribonucleoside-diphosphate reductase assembly flavoprotein NrdI [Shimia sp. R11_0]|uniref:class Ib ribonucleoside-diphosphate reductase assembly flavoprotein NrdI n=1 Tax=Shimia sp. R11_0 TaxID=2821096 RepID=UPI001ADA22AC|nr:class Ib ribonucleoside-diphosphate reductase assembly flavoprotein NrdI [Shimia sp. R11_0]MBO9477921.1 class Ib ribonucleoside-diphosphate reductase assembly flavoprotein NrdI [Shimia sp. R11_0]